MLAVDHIQMSFGSQANNAYTIVCIDKFMLPYFLLELELELRLNYPSLDYLLQFLLFDVIVGFDTFEIVLSERLN